MNYYYGNATEPFYAEYESERLCYPVFEEKYGKEGNPFSTEIKLIQMLFVPVDIQHSFHRKL